MPKVWHPSSSDAIAALHPHIRGPYFAIHLNHMKDDTRDAAIPSSVDVYVITRGPRKLGSGPTIRTYCTPTNSVASQTNTIIHMKRKS